MKKLASIDPFILCERVKVQDQVLNNIIIPGQEDRSTTIRRVVCSSTTARARNIEEGDIVVTRINKFQELPVWLTTNDQIPFDTKETLEVVDPALVVALYKEQPVATIEEIPTPGEE